MLHYKQPSLGDGEGWGGDTERGEERETGKRGRDAEKARKRRVSEGEWEGCTGGREGHGQEGEYCSSRGGRGREGGSEEGQRQGGRALIGPSRIHTLQGIQTKRTHCL